MKKFISTGIIVSTFLLNGCFHESDNNKPDGIACTEEARAGINLLVTDSDSGDALASKVKAIIRDGEYREKLEYIGIDEEQPYLSGAYERSGKYRVVVKLDGYQDWKKTGVKVEEDVCHVIPVTIKVKMIRL